jgi:hypothetical protein
MIAGDENDGCLGQGIVQPLELAEGKQDGGVGGPNRMKQIAGDHHRIRSGRDDTVYGGTERVGDISLALVDAAGGLPMVLPDSEMWISDMSQFHGWRILPPHRRGQRFWC